MNNGIVLIIDHLLSDLRHFPKPINEYSSVNNSTILILWPRNLNQNVQFENCRVLSNTVFFEVADSLKFAAHLIENRSPKWRIKPRKPPQSRNTKFEGISFFVKESFECQKS